MGIGNGRWLSPSAVHVPIPSQCMEQRRQVTLVGNGLSPWYDTPPSSSGLNVEQFLTKKMRARILLLFY